MTDLIDVLYSYAQDYVVRGLLDREPEYAEVCRCANRQEQALRELVGKESEEHLADLLEEQRLMTFLEKRALFLAGFQIALELTR